MGKGTTFVALDDSKRKVVVAILHPGAVEPECREIPKEPHLIRRRFQRLAREGSVQACTKRGCPAMIYIARSPRVEWPVTSWLRR